MTVSIIAAVATNNVIGRNNQLPWHLPADLKRFKQLTSGHHLLMGRRTFESVGSPLPGRITVVISRDPAFAPQGVAVARSLDEAIAKAEAAGDPEIFVGGGTAVFQ